MGIRSLNRLKNLNKPFVIVMVGAPLSGKSTWISKNFPNTKVISRDQILLDSTGISDYNDAWKVANQKTVNKILKSKMRKAGESNESYILDMTHMSKKSRAKNLAYFPNHYAIAVVMPVLSNIDYQVRNSLRDLEEGKYIPLSVISDMVSNFEYPDFSENFEEIVSVI
jgi:predicted kinase